MFLSFIILTKISWAQNSQNFKNNQVSPNEDLQVELQEFLKMREKMYNELLNDNTVFDENAKALIKRLMKNQNISGFSGFEDQSYKFKFVWKQNILFVFNVTNEDEIEIQVNAKTVLISGVHKSKNDSLKINQTIHVPESLNFKTHKIEYKLPNFEITFL